MLAVSIGCEKSDDLPLEQNQSKNLSNQNFHLDLAYYHAPVHYQDMDRTGSHGLKGKADYITRYDFDGDLNAKNNWNNISNSSKKGNAVDEYFNGLGDSSKVYTYNPYIGIE